VTQALAAEHERRLGARYRARFPEADIRAHLAALDVLSPGRPVIASVRPLEGDRLSCTVAAFDYPAEFSLITGILSASGVSIVSGDAFTWSPAPEGTPPELARRRIVDVFVGTSDALRDPDTARALEERLAAVIAPLEAGTEEALTRARRTVNELAAGAVARAPGPATGELQPVEIEVRPAGAGRLAMVVTAQDTPFFLYTFSTALSLQGVAIEGVAIRTEGDRIEDSFEVADLAGRTFDDPGRIDRIRLAVLLTKQFTAFLGRAPDPLAALSRFEQLVGRVLEAPGQGRWLEVLADGAVLADLARLLGASTFLWEDFVRQQYETLLPMLRPHVAGRRFAGPAETIAERLDRHLAGIRAGREAAFAERLNAFKDHEIFLYDLDHLLTPGFDFRELSRCLTALAEAVVDRAVRFAHRGLAARFGEPRTVAGMPARLAVLGLGKMGGAALGYASDIELLFVYSDAGATAGAGEAGASAGGDSLDNAEFFDRLVREVLRLVRAKREGIFHLDLRLRPHGQAGPLASSLGAFCAYYAPGGTADAWERLALVRLRAVAGDAGLGARVERLRDELVYAAHGPDPASLRRLRERQIVGAVPPGRLNAKYSPGALVDLEYAVQALQLQHGGTEPRLRTPRIHEALAALAHVGALDPGEAQGLADSYRFFRLLINSLRMLRGSARDLLIPPAGDDELLHLARRMGYGPGSGLDPARALALDVETHTAFVRAFLERRFGRDAVPGPARIGVADLVLSDAVPADVARETLARRGFRDPARALANLRSLAGAGPRAEFARLAVLACDILAGMPDPDMALNNWERFRTASASSSDRPEASLAQPMRLEILLSLCSASQFLADTLIADPPLLDWLGAPGVLDGRDAADALARELTDRSATTAGDDTAWRETLRAVRRRELLRTGARDFCLGVSTRRVMTDLSDLADALIAAALDRAAADEGPAAPALCILALGKLGARELNYSSDVDLVCLCGTDLDTAAAALAARMVRRLRADLSDRTPGGHAGRVDLRLRPWGGAGELVTPVASLRAYYTQSAGAWELQAMLQARPVAGDLPAGDRFLAFIHELIARPQDPGTVIDVLVRSRRHAAGQEGDLKNGPGGIRDVEFLVQGLRLLHAAENPDLAAGGTLAALAALAQTGFLGRDDARELEDDYLFFRRVEHFLQVYEDRQVHRLPRDPVELRALARRMLGSGATAEGLLADLDARFLRVRERFARFVSGPA
jgi:glutamate-ammonia-ligase adenylyltransferase